MHKLRSRCFPSVFGAEEQTGCEKGMICRIGAAKRQEWGKNKAKRGENPLQTVERSDGGPVDTRSEHLLERKQGEQKRTYQEKNEDYRINGEIYSKIQTK